MEETRLLRVFGVVAAVFGTAGLVLGKPVHLAIAGLSLALLVGELLMGGRDITRRRTSLDRTDSAPRDRRR